MTIIGIYGIENRVEHKWYVGKSINLYKRLGGHIDRLRRGDHPLLDLQADYNRLGHGAFEVYVLEFCDLNVLNKRECFWIKEKDAVKNGYCTSTGGYSANGVKHSEEAKRKQSEAQKGHVVSQETRNKISQSNKGRDAGFGGHHHTDEAKEKIAQAKRGVPMSQSVKDAVSKANKGKTPVNRKKVICIDTGEIFLSVRLAGQSVGGSGSALSGALTRGKTYKGYLFKYLDDNEREAS